MNMEKIPKFHEDKLTAEMIALRDKLGNQLGFLGSDESTDAIWVFRLFQGISPEEWDSLATKYNLTGWLTLPVDGNAFPHVKHLQKTLERLTYQTDHDTLTGLANRRAFDRTLDIEIERSKRINIPLSLAIFDLDDFKSVNDTYGHPKGDEVLATFAKLLKETTRRYDLAVRYGGEEFALLMAGSSLQRAQRLLNRLLKDFRKIKFTSPDDKTHFNVTCSAGLTYYKGTEDIDSEALIKLADDALYEAKALGKNRIKVSPLPFVDNIPNETLVQAHEKQFLFGGK